MPASQASAGCRPVHPAYLLGGLDCLQGGTVAVHVLAEGFLSLYVSLLMLVLGCTVCAAWTLRTFGRLQQLAHADCRACLASAACTLGLLVAVIRKQ